MNSMSLNLNSRFDIMVAAAGRRCLYGAANGPAYRQPSGAERPRNLRTSCPSFVRRDEALRSPERRPQALTGVECCRTTRKQQDGSRRPGSSSTTALGVAVRISASFAFVRGVAMLCLQTHSSAIRSLLKHYE